MHFGWAVALIVVLIGTTVVWGSALGWRTTDRSLRRALAGEIRIDRLVLHFPRDLSDRLIENLVRDAAYSAAQVEQALGIVQAESIHVWFFEDVESKRRLTGAGRTAIAKPYRREIHIQWGGYPHGSLLRPAAGVCTAMCEWRNSTRRLSENKSEPHFPSHSRCRHRVMFIFRW